MNPDKLTKFPHAPWLEVSTPDRKTQVTVCKGSRYPVHFGRDTLPGECSSALPPSAIEEAVRQPLTSTLLPCAIGIQPQARGQSVCRPQGDWNYTLLFCRDGAGMVEMTAGSQRLGPGMFALLQPGEYHAYAADGVKPWSIYWVQFCGSQADEYFRLITEGGRKRSRSVMVAPGVIQGFERILSLYSDDQSYRCLVQASTLLHGILGELMCQQERAARATLSGEERVRQTISLIEESLHRAVGIDELAAAANMSPSYFAAQFRQRTGENPRTYINKLKIARACEILARDDLKVEVVARHLGYQDPFYFCRVFKRLTGETTSGYRQKCLWRLRAGAAEGTAATRTQTMSLAQGARR